MSLALQSLLGLAVFVAICWGMSEQRDRVPWRVVGAGLVAQVVLAAVFLKLPPVRDALLVLNDLVLAIQEATRAGTRFVFGYIGGGDPPFAVTSPGATFVLGFQALPIILVMSALSALLFHWRILPWVVQGFAWGFRRLLGVGGAAGVGAAANIFVGMVEAPLLIRPYVATLSRRDLFVVMTCGMATIAGTVMVLYASFLTGVVDNPLGQILTASLLSAPAAILVALMLVPGDPPADEAEAQRIAREEVVLPPSEAASTIDAITLGTLQGVQLMINVAALLLVMVALVALVNMGLGGLPDIGGAPLTLERMLGWLMAPVCWLMGIPWAEAAEAGALMGVKTILNELIAYLRLSGLPAGTLSDRSTLILTYALCGFANVGSLGIMIGGLVGMAPERRAEIARLGLKSILSGTLATCMTGAVVGLVVW